MISSFALLLGTVLQGCVGTAAPLPAPCSAPDSSPAVKTISVYFGCGCFWHVQHAFVLLEMSELCRQGRSITARVAYAGGKRTGADDLVCYHNAMGKADYGALGHAEAVTMTLPESNFSSFAAKFWELCPGGGRQDPQDMGGEYRSFVGLPGGMHSRLLPQLQEKAGSTKLVVGSGDDGDTLGTSQVLVYDTSAFPARIAEKYHQFHDDMMESYGSAYKSLQRWASVTQCPGDGGSLRSLFQ